MCVWRVVCVGVLEVVILHNVETHREHVGCVCVWCVVCGVWCVLVYVCDGEAVGERKRKREALLTHPTTHQ